MKNRYPNEVKVELNKMCNKKQAEEAKGDLCITIYQHDGSVASNHQLTKESFLKFVVTQYKKEIKQELNKEG